MQARCKKVLFLNVILRLCFQRAIAAKKRAKKIRRNRKKRGESREP